MRRPAKKGAQGQKTVQGWSSTCIEKKGFQTTGEKARGRRRRSGGRTRRRVGPMGGKRNRIKRPQAGRRREERCTDRPVLGKKKTQFSSVKARSKRKERRRGRKKFRRAYNNGPDI